MQELSSRRSGAGPLLAAFERHVARFVETGHPTTFGRLEGLKEAAELLGDQETVDAMSRMVNEKHEEMARWTT